VAWLAGGEGENRFFSKQKKKKKKKKKKRKKKKNKKKLDDFRKGEKTISKRHAMQAGDF